MKNAIMLKNLKILNSYQNQETISHKIRLKKHKIGNYSISH